MSGYQARTLWVIPPQEASIAGTTRQRRFFGSLRYTANGRCDVRRFMNKVSLAQKPPQYGYRHKWGLCRPHPGTVASVLFTGLDIRKTMSRCKRLSVSLLRYVRARSPIFVYAGDTSLSTVRRCRKMVMGGFPLGQGAFAQSRCFRTPR